MISKIDQMKKMFSLMEENEKKQRNMKPMLRPGSKTFQEYDSQFKMILNKHNTIRKQSIQLRQTFTCIKKHSSYKDFDQLENIVLKDMYVNKVHEGKYLEAKIIYKPLVLTGIQTLIEDQNGDIEKLSIYNLIKDFDEKVEDLLPLGCIVRIKEPFLKISVENVHSYSIRVDSPSDLEIIITVPKTIDQDIMTLIDKYNYQGNCHFVNKEYHLAVQSYTKALSLKQNIKSFTNRSLVYLRLECYQLALNDAEKSVQIEPNEKGYYRMASAWYNMRQYDKSMEQFKNCLDINAANKDAKIGLEKCSTRIKESKGIFDFKYFIEESGQKNLRVDGADFTSDKIELVNLGGKKGRGFVANVDIPKSTLLIASKALSISFDHEFLNKNCLISYNLLNRTIDKNSQCQNLMNLIYRMRFDPYLSNQVYSLYAGSKFNRDTLVPNGIIDTERIEAICTFNSFKSDDLRMLKKEFDNSGLWHMPSFFNHSCLANTYRIHLSDFVFIFTCKNVKKGEELTTPYFPLDSLEEREKRAKSFGFKCNCAMCEEERNDLVNVKKRAQLLKNLDNLKTKNDAKKWKSFIENLKMTYQNRNKYKYDLISPYGHLAKSLMLELKLNQGIDCFKKALNLSKECGDLTTAIKINSEINRLLNMTEGSQEAKIWLNSTEEVIDLDPFLIEHISSQH